MAATTPPDIDHTAHIYASGRLALVLVVAQHRSELLGEPEDRTLARLDAMHQKWEGFLEITNDDPDSRLAINEGPRRQVVPGETGLEAYKRGGEPTLLTRWAQQGDAEERPIEVMSGEMALCGETSHLLRCGFSPEAVWLHYILRAFASWVARDPQPEPTDFINTLAHNYAAALSEYPAFDDFDFSPAHLGQIHQRYYDSDVWRFDPGAADFAEQVTHPDFAPTIKAARDLYGNHVVQNIAYECNVTRDHHFITLYEQKIMMGRRIFSMLGWPHYFSMQPAFARLQERLESGTGLTAQGGIFNSRELSADTTSKSYDDQRTLRRNREDYDDAPAAGVEELLADRPGYTLGIDYDHLARLCRTVEGVTRDGRVEIDQESLSQRAIAQLAAHRKQLREFAAAFEGNALMYNPKLRRLQINSTALQMLQKQGYYINENIQSAVDSLPVVVGQQPHAT